jgi:hypothetical protein
VAILQVDPTIAVTLSVVVTVVANAALLAATITLRHMAKAIHVFLIIEFPSPLSRSKLAISAASRSFTF